ncbi:hypothetical protein SCOCK_340008 [Actinacidiphila cocklensis]|uniref:Uncharacterized protein n=1 Tax=Actinacidiphila cocklensis TaxID=887465 RepID=A0A9W4DT85_9ACTN|nr:hypothetical protein SCOCK_340008 [Actinacidiphila cocklensis]
MKYRQPVARGNILPPFPSMTVSCHCAARRRVGCGGGGLQGQVISHCTDFVRICLITATDCNAPLTLYEHRARLSRADWIII